LCLELKNGALGAAEIVLKEFLLHRIGLGTTLCVLNVASYSKVNDDDEEEDGDDDDNNNNNNNNNNICD
jgi:hypothetical protein